MIAKFFIGQKFFFYLGVMLLLPTDGFARMEVHVMRTAKRFDITSRNPFHLNLKRPPAKGFTIDDTNSNKTALLITWADKNNPSLVEAFGQLSSYVIIPLSEGPENSFSLETFPGSKFLIHLSPDSPGKKVVILGKTFFKGLCFIDEKGNCRPGVEPTKNTLKDTDSGIRWLAARFLEMNGWKPEFPEDEITYLIAAQKWGELTKRGKIAVGALILFLKDDDPDVRKEAAAMLGEIKDFLAVDSLIATLGDENSDVREKASEALKKIIGQDFGVDQKKWQDWWEKNKVRLIT